MFQVIGEAMTTLDADEASAASFSGAGGKARCGCYISEFETVRGTKAAAKLAGDIERGPRRGNGVPASDDRADRGLCIGGGSGSRPCAICGFAVRSRFGVPVKRLGLVESPES